MLVNTHQAPDRPIAQLVLELELELELELIQTHMAQKPMLRVEVGARNIRGYSHLKPRSGSVDA